MSQRTLPLPSTPSSKLARNSITAGFNNNSNKKPTDDTTPLPSHLIFKVIASQEDLKQIDALRRRNTNNTNQDDSLLFNNPPVVDMNNQSSIITTTTTNPDSTTEGEEEGEDSAIQNVQE
jgi:hypothetical protein